MKRLLIIFFIGISILLIVNKMSPFTFPWVDKDKALLQALKFKNLRKFERLLKNGANPNAIFGENQENWVMCLATKRGNLSFLKLAIEYAGDINLRNRHKPVETLYSAPILCSIMNRNYKIFDYLLDQGVDLSIHTYEKAQPIPQDFLGDPKLIGKTLYGTPLIESIDQNEYCMGVKILKRKKLNWEESINIIKDVELSSVDPGSERDKCRIRIISMLRQQGYKIDPEKAKREHEERRRKWRKENGF